MTKAGLMRNGSYDGDTEHAYRNGQSWTSNTMRVSWPSIRVVHARNTGARLISRKTTQLPDQLPATTRLVEESGRRVETLVEVLVGVVGALVQRNVRGTIPVFFDIQIVVEDE